MKIAYFHSTSQRGLEACFFWFFFLEKNIPPKIHTITLKAKVITFISYSKDLKIIVVIDYRINPSHPLPF